MSNCDRKEQEVDLVLQGLSPQLSLAFIRAFSLLLAALAADTVLRIGIVAWRWWGIG